MIKKLLWLGTSAPLALLALALAQPPRILSSAEAESTLAGVLLDNFRCQTVAVCDTYNYPLDAPCPKSLPCRTCEFASRGITNCVQSAGSVCDWRSSRGSKCGKERIGLCPSTAICANLVFYGTFCTDLPLRRCAPAGGPRAGAGLDRVDLALLFG